MLPQTQLTRGHRLAQAHSQSLLPARFRMTPEHTMERTPTLQRTLYAKWKSKSVSIFRLSDPQKASPWIGLTQKACAGTRP